MRHPTSPTNWDPTSHPDFKGLLKKATQAGKHGDPDPTKSDLAPACFWALNKIGLDQMHHRVGFFMQEIESDRLLLAANRGPLAEKNASEVDERRMVAALQAAERIRSRYQICQTDLGSIIAAISRIDSEMQQVYRRYYPYAAHLGELVFPELKMADVRYGDDDLGFGLASLIPKRPDGSMPSSAIALKEVESR